MFEPAGPLAFLGRLFSEQTSGFESLSLLFVVAAVAIALGFLLYLVLTVFFWAAYLHRSIPLRQVLSGANGRQPKARAEILVVAVTALALSLVLAARSDVIRATLETPVNLASASEESGAGFPLRVVPNQDELGLELQDASIPLASVLRPLAAANDPAGAERAILSVLDRDSFRASREEARRTYGRWLPALAALLVLAFVARLAFLRSLRLDQDPRAKPEYVQVIVRLPLLATCSALLILAPAALADRSIVRGALSSLDYHPSGEASATENELGPALSRAIVEQDRLYRNLRLLRTDPDDGDAKTVWDLLGSTQSSLHNLNARMSALSSDTGDLTTRISALEPAAEALRLELTDLDEQLAAMSEALESGLAAAGDQLSAAVDRLSAIQAEDRVRDQRNLADLERSLEQVQRQVAQTERAASDVEGQIAELRRSTGPKLSQLENFLRVLPRLESRIAELETERANAAGQMSGIEETLRNLAQRISDLEG